MPNVGGQFFGGAADACIKWKSGELQQQLAETTHTCWRTKEELAALRAKAAQREGGALLGKVPVQARGHRTVLGIALDGIFLRAVAAT